MQCNIDARGKRVRLISGIVVTLIGGGLLAWTAGGVARHQSWGWAVGGALVLGGAFQIFEGWRGWCALRAIGFKTRI
jgi:hypothetical protein